MALSACELMWIKYLLNDLSIKTRILMNLYCDNKAAIHISSNHLFHEHTKDVKIDCHFIRKKVITRIINTKYVNSKDRPADILTKAIHRELFHHLSKKLGLHSPSCVA